MTRHPLWDFVTDVTKPPWADEHAIAIAWIEALETLKEFVRASLTSSTSVSEATLTYGPEENKKV